MSGGSTCIGKGGINMSGGRGDQHAWEVYMLGGATCFGGGLHAWQRGATCLVEGGRLHGGGGYMLGRGGLHAWQRWGDYMLERGGNYMLGRGGDTCLAKEGGITLTVQYKSIQSYIEDNPVKMIFCCAVVQMQMIIFSSTHTILRFKCRVIKKIHFHCCLLPATVGNTQILICRSEAINCNSMSDIHPLVSILLSRM